MSKHKIEFTLPADLKFSSLVRRISEEIFHYVGFVTEWAERLKLVVDELFMNANHYGSSGPEDKIYMRFEFDNNEVTFRIDDEGKGENKTTAEELRKKIKKNSDEMADITKTNGRGLALISNLWTDEMAIEDGQYGGIAITFTKKITTSAPPALPPIQPLGPGVATSAIPRGTKEEIKVTGEIDASNLAEKVKPVEEKLKILSPGSTLILDCKELVYFNSTFIGHMAAWINQLHAKQGSLVLKNANPKIQEVLKLVGLTKVLYLES
ncbi:ATP-binding protein [Candidatus Peregrinibacteria bacterium]|nr:ATP-binding protein [Candidatus Peregrinibacteria bacterium]